MKCREEGWQSMIDGLRERDQAKIEKATEKSQEADQTAVERFNGRAKMQK